MLFDLRSRGRRRTVRVVYAFLAIVMVVGLVGLGIGTGSTGGILNAGSNGGSGGGGGNQLADQQLKRALTAVKKHPTAANWANLLQARWTVAGSGSNFNSTTSTYTTSGRKQLQYGADAWQQYLKVASPQQQTGSAFLQTAFLAAGIYQNLGQWSNEGQAWNLAVQATSGTQRLKPYLCLAYSSYAAKQTTKGDLAAAQAVKLLPKLDRLSQKLALKSASTSPTVAEQGLAQNC